LTYTKIPGGAFQLITFGALLSAKYPTFVANPGTIHSSIILDSCPGNDNFERTRLAFTAPIRNPLSRFLATVFITVLYIYFRVQGWFYRVPGTLERLRSSLFESRILPWVSKNTPRLYVYSKADKMVDWRVVEKHSSHARELGLNTREVVFENSPHVAHARADPARYWEAVRKVWADGEVN